MNVHVSGYRVDVLFTSEQLIVELDGWATHQTHAAFIADRHQDAEILARTGIPTVRITYERFHRQAAQEAVRLQAILARRTADLRGAG
jgi:very-short-patch-repair endonuclease